MRSKTSPPDTASHITASARHTQNGIHPGAPGAPDTPVAVEARGPVAAWLRFWFTPADPAGLHVLRVLSGLLFAFWLVALVGHQIDFFSLSGWMDAQAYKEAGRLPGGAPAPFGWSILYLCGTNTGLVNAVYWASIVVLLLFAAGIATRLTSVLTWVVVVSFVANPAISFDADFLLVVLAFYLMMAYVLFGLWSRSLSPLDRFLGPNEGGLLALLAPGRRRAAPAPSYAVNLALRLLQVHFVLVVVTGALHKLQMGDWWAGVAFWYPMHPPLRTDPTTLRTGLAVWQTEIFALSLAGYATLAWQFAFPLFAWRRGWWRVVLLGGAALGWLGCFFIYGLPLFGPIFVIAALAFLTPQEWRAVVAWLRNLVPTLASSSELVAAGAGKISKVGN